MVWSQKMLAVHFILAAIEACLFTKLIPLLFFVVLNRLNSTVVTHWVIRWNVMFCCTSNTIVCKKMFNHWCVTTDSFCITDAYLSVHPVYESRNTKTARQFAIVGQRLPLCFKLQSFIVSSPLSSLIFSYLFHLINILLCCYFLILLW